LIVNYVEFTLIIFSFEMSTAQRKFPTWQEAAYLDTLQQRYPTAYLLAFRFGVQGLDIDFLPESPLTYFTFCGVGYTLAITGYKDTATCNQVSHGIIEFRN
jgi:hypothetical protein